MLRVRKRLALDLLEGRTGRLVDVGCGSATMAVDLVKLGYRFIGVDAAPAMIEAGRPAMAERGAVSLGVADGEHLPFPTGSVEALLCLGVIDRVPDAAAALTEACRVLRPGGEMVVSFLNLWSPYYAWRLHVFYPLVRAAKRAMALLTREPVQPHLAIGAWCASPRQVERLLRDRGVVVDDVVHYHFNMLPSPVDELLPSVALRLARRADRLADTGWRRLSGAFLVRAHRLP